MIIDKDILISVTNKDLKNGIFTIPKEIIEIGCKAFATCTNLKKVIFNEKLKWIHGSSFSNCRKLPPATDKDEIIKTAKKYLKNNWGLCPCLKYSLRDHILKYKEALCLETTFPLFTQENAIKHFGGRNEGYWWDLSDKEIRIKFLDYINK